jgi:hypothetical protein
VSIQNNVRTLCAFVIFALLCGCAATSPVPPTGTTAAAPAVPQKSKGATMVVSDAGAGDVVLMAYPSGKVLSTLTGFSEPQGACSDGAGHFWITSTTAASVLEFSTDGTKIGTLDDPAGLPVGCAYDPKTGDLAVTNILSKSYGMGSLEIYKAAKGTPKTYSVPSMYKIFFAAYAGSTGTLVIDGLSSSYQFALTSFRNETFKAISLQNTPIQFPGGVAWSTKLNSMNVGDQDTSTIYRFDLNGKVTGKFTASGSDIGNYALFGGTLVVPTSEGIDIYAYPHGNGPKHIVNGPPGGFSQPIGIAISSAVTE